MKKVFLSIAFVLAISSSAVNASSMGKLSKNASVNTNETVISEDPDCFDLLYEFIVEFDENHPGNELTVEEVQWLSYDLCNW